MRVGKRCDPSGLVDQSLPCTDPSRKQPCTGSFGRRSLLSATRSPAPISSESSRIAAVLGIPVPTRPQRYGFLFLFSVKLLGVARRLSHRRVNLEFTVRLVLGPFTSPTTHQRGLSCSVRNRIAMARATAPSSCFRANRCVLAGPPMAWRGQRGPVGRGWKEREGVEG